LMEALTSSACAIAVPSKCCGEPLSIVKLNTVAVAVNHDAPLKPQECAIGQISIIRDRTAPPSVVWFRRLFPERTLRRTASGT
jgi:hypothetical protein